MSEQYLNILQESLEKKLSVLDEILRISHKQSDILTMEPVDFEQFDRCVDDKDICIEQLEKLDEGFEMVYEKVKQELHAHREQYAAWIADTQKMIAQIMERSVAIQAQEARNKQAVEQVLQKERRGYGKGKRSAKAAMDYYRHMSNTQVVDPQFMDQKK